MWNALDEIGLREGMKIHDLATMIDAARGDTSMTSAARVFVMTYYIVLAEEVEAILAGLRPTKDGATPTKAPPIADKVIARAFQSPR